MLRWRGPGMPGGMKSGPKNQRNISYGSLLLGPMAGLRTGTASVVRILTTEPSVSATTCVKSGTASTGTGVGVGCALVTAPIVVQATSSVAEAHASSRLIFPLLV